MDPVDHGAYIQEMCEFHSKVWWVSGFSLLQTPSTFFFFLFFFSVQGTSASFPDQCSSFNKDFLSACYVPNSDGGSGDVAWTTETQSLKCSLQFNALFSPFLHSSELWIISGLSGDIIISSGLSLDNPLWIISFQTNFPGFDPSFYQHSS